MPVCTIMQEFEVTSLSWLPPENYLIVGGSMLTLWKFDWEVFQAYRPGKGGSGLEGGGVLSKTLRLKYEEQRQNEERQRQEQLYSSIWKTACSSPVHHIECTADGKYFSSAGKYDKVIKVWYRLPSVEKPKRTW